MYLHTYVIMAGAHRDADTDTVNHTHTRTQIYTYTLAITQSDINYLKQSRARMQWPLDQININLPHVVASSSGKQPAHATHRHTCDSRVHVCDNWQHKRCMWHCLVWHFNELHSHSLNYCIHLGAATGATWGTCCSCSLQQSNMHFKSWPLSLDFRLEVTPIWPAPQIGAARQDPTIFV